jgi:hypothetical protein
MKSISNETFNTFDQSQVQFVPSWTDTSLGEYEGEVTDVPVLN